MESLRPVSFQEEQWLHYGGSFELTGEGYGGLKNDHGGGSGGLKDDTDFGV